MRYETLDRTAARDIGRRAEVALRGALAELGLDVQYRGGTFDPQDGTLRARFVISLSEVGGKPAEQVRFERNAPLFGIPAETYGRTVTFASSTYRLIGLMPLARRFPVIAKRESDGRTFKLPLASLDKFKTPARISEQVAAATSGGRRKA